MIKIILISLALAAVACVLLRFGVILLIEHFVDRYNVRNRAIGRKIGIDL